MGEMGVVAAVEEFEGAHAAGHELLPTVYECREGDGAEWGAGVGAVGAGVGAAAGGFGVGDALGEVLVGVVVVGEDEGVEVFGLGVDDLRGSREIVSVEGVLCPSAQSGFAFADDEGVGVGGVVGEGFGGDLGAAEYVADVGVGLAEDGEGLGDDAGVPEVGGVGSDAGGAFGNGFGELEGEDGKVGFEGLGTGREGAEVGVEGADGVAGVGVACVDRDEEDVAGGHVFLTLFVVEREAGEEEKEVGEPRGEEGGEGLAVG